MSKSKMILKLNGSIPYFITHINYFELDVLISQAINIKSSNISIEF